MFHTKEIMDKSLRLIIFVAAVAIVGLYSCKKQEKTGNTGNNTHIGITDIKLDKNTLELKEGDTVTLKVAILPENATDKRVSWLSSKPEVATVDATGKVSAIAKGEASIIVIAVDGGKAAVCNVKVKANFDPSSTVNGVKFEFAAIPEGSFFMGSPEDEPERGKDEIRHKVTLSAFFMSKYEVTQAQWKAVMGNNNNPSYFVGDNLPVEQVSYNDVRKFITKLNDITGKEYRLPTEAEWEYACRAGTDTPFGTGNNITTDEANYDGQYPYNKNPKGVNRQKTTAVGTFKPNAWGLYDMHGNVWEWCSDLYGEYSSADQTNPKGPATGSTVVNRGGSWLNEAAAARSANRYDDKPEHNFSNLGFRLAISAK